MPYIVLTRDIMLPRDQTFTFGPFTFSRERGLWRGTEPVPLRHVERQLLKCLLDRPGEIVRKEEISATLWPPNTSVSDNTLSVHVRRLRITLGDTKRPYRWLKAFPRMGYMLVATPQRRHPLSATEKRAAPGDRSRFVRDVSLPDGTIMPPGERFEKVWEIQNVGSVVWRSRHLRRIGACSGPGRIGSDPLTAVPLTKSGALCLVRMWLTAPPDAGSYYAAWKMVDDKGNECFPRMRPLFVSIDVLNEAL
jgi:DNA-binding winged helix-turn-helix (wHTH) protein